MPISVTNPDTLKPREKLQRIYRDLSHLADRLNVFTVSGKPFTISVLAVGYKKLAQEYTPETIIEVTVGTFPDRLNLDLLDASRFRRRYVFTTDDAVSVTVNDTHPRMATFASSREALADLFDHLVREGMQYLSQATDVRRKGLEELRDAFRRG